MMLNLVTSPVIMPVGHMSRGHACEFRGVREQEGLVHRCLEGDSASEIHLDSEQSLTVYDVHMTDPGLQAPGST